eukprot:14540044-Alexandrium_andersonii.AAC.1
MSAGSAKPYLWGAALAPPPARTFRFPRRRASSTSRTRPATSRPSRARATRGAASGAGGRR